MRYLLIHLILLFPIICWGQNDRFNPLAMPVSVQDDIWSVEFAPNFWLNNTQAPAPHKFSFSAGINYHYELNFSVEKRMALAFGFGYRFSTLSHLGTFTNDSTSSTVWNASLPNDEIKFSRLNTHSIQIPIELRLKFKSLFKLYLGYSFEFVVGANNRSSINGATSRFDNFKSINRFQHGPKIRIGYKDFFVFSKFYMSNIFRTTPLIPLQVFEIGLSIGG